jgi:hypothetical protein
VLVQPLVQAFHHLGQSSSQCCKTTVWLI